MQQETISPVATTTTPALTAIATITNVENLFVFVLLESLTREVLDVPVTFCATSIEATGVVAVGPIDELGLIELAGKTVIFGTKEGVA